MDKKLIRRKRIKTINREELLQLTKDDLVNKIIQLEAHNVQLKNIISKGISNQSGKKEKTKNIYNFTKCHFRRILLRVMYFGWDYHGLAVQEDSMKTIEHHLFGALTRTCLIEDRESSQYHRCGRTDKGVSSFGQVISIRVRSNCADEDQMLPEKLRNEIAYCKILNRLLPEDIRTISWMPIPSDKPDFSARFDCNSRIYKYYFPKSGLNIEAMNDACTFLVGSHDFRNLCKMDVGNGVLEFIRDIKSAAVLPVYKNDELNGTSMYFLRIEGNAFLWHQIRCIFGILILIGLSREPVTIIKDLLDIEKYPRKPQYNMALDIPLNLYQCSYDVGDNTWIFDEEELEYVIRQLQGSWTIHNIKSTMIKDCLHALEDEYSKLVGARQVNGDSDWLERDGIIAYADCLIQGVKPKVYKALLDRDTCSSLEERIEFYRKKRKIIDDEDASRTEDALSE